MKILILFIFSLGLNAFAQVNSPLRTIGSPKITELGSGKYMKVYSLNLSDDGIDFMAYCENGELMLSSEITLNDGWEIINKNEEIHEGGIQVLRYDLHVKKSLAPEQYIRFRDMVTPGLAIVTCQRSQ